MPNHREAHPAVRPLERQNEDHQHRPVKERQKQHEGGRQRVEVADVGDRAGAAQIDAHHVVVAREIGAEPRPDQPGGAGDGDFHA